MNIPATRADIESGVNCVPQFPNRRARRMVLQPNTSQNGKMTRGKLAHIIGKTQRKNGLIFYLGKFTSINTLRKAI